MPFEINLDILPSGYALSSAKPGTEIKIAVREFISSDDGEKFISRLEGVPDNIFSQLPPNSDYHQSTVDHFLAIIRKDKTALVYVNEIKIMAEIQGKRGVSKGDPIFYDDIADIVDAVRFGLKS